MRRVLLLTVALFAFMGIDSAVAQSRTSYFMEGSYFRSELNPALAPTRGYLALPGISGVGIDMSSNYRSAENFLFERNGEIVSGFDPAVSADDFLGNLPELCNSGTTVNAQILGVGFYKKRKFWSFGIGSHLTASSSISRDMFSTLKQTGTYVNPNGTASMEGTGYLDAYVGVSFPVCKWLNLGVKAKFLVGVVNLDFDIDSATTTLAGSDIAGTLRGKWRLNGLLRRNEYIAADGSYDLPAGVNDDSFGYLISNAKSFGAAIDFGAEFRLLGDHLRISAAVTDLGFIRWAPETHVGGNVVADYRFEGLDGNNVLDMNIETNEDSFTPGAYEAYTTRLNCSLNVGVEYNILNNHIAFGLLSHTRFSNKSYYTELTASVNFRATNWLTATVSHTFLNGTKPGIFGAAINIHPAAINIFLGIDYIGTSYTEYALDNKSLYLPTGATSYNVYAGVGFNFGRPKHLK